MDVVLNLGNVGVDQASIIQSHFRKHHICIITYIIFYCDKYKPRFKDVARDYTIKMNQFLYLNNITVKTTQGNTTQFKPCQRLIPVANIQWLEYDQQHNVVRIMYNNQHQEEYTSKSNPKQHFYHYLKETRVQFKVIEWDG